MSRPGAVATMSATRSRAIPRARAERACASLPVTAIAHPARPTSRHPIRNRLALSVGASVLLGLLSTGIVLAGVALTVNSLTERTERARGLMSAAVELKTAVFNQETFAFDYALTHADRALDELHEAETAEIDAYTSIARLAGTDPTINTALVRVRDLTARWREDWMEPYVEQARTGRGGPNRLSLDESEPLYAPAEAAIGDLEGLIQSEQALAVGEAHDAVPRLATIVIPIGLAMTILLALVGLWLARTISGPLVRLDRTAQQLVAGGEVTFGPERDDEIGQLAVVLERLRLDASGRYDSARREAERAATFNRLAELTSFADDDEGLVNAAVVTLRRLIPTTRGDVLLVNSSESRLIVGAAWGDAPPEVGSPVPVSSVDRCPGIRRAMAYVVSDAGDEMAVSCPAHRVASGSVACVPLTALGKTIGVVHLERAEGGGFGSDDVEVAARVAEHVALAIANARLMRTMEGLAMTDQLTGLRNARFFDPYLEQELAVAERDRTSLSVVMIDLDHFKQFNDEHGHPAGDEALRVFSRVVRSLVRDSDVISRYGGEEFILAFRHATLAEAEAKAESIREAIAQTVIEIGPGRYARMTASFGVASTEGRTVDRKSLVSLADAALYRAKELGRNRVESAPTGEADLEAAANRRRGRDARATEPTALPSARPGAGPADRVRRAG
jgi:diguanylate cyclase (GGDEF)-like protein